jgi:hypothetical protein
VAIYVLYRTPEPDGDTVDEVMEKLEEAKIDVRQLLIVPTNHCR